MKVWGASGKRTWIHGQHKADPGSREVDFPETRDPGRNVPTKDVHCNLVAEGQAQFNRLLARKRHLRRSGIAFGPPFAVRDLCPLGRTVRVGDATIPLQNPVLARNFLSRLSVDPGDDAPKHRCTFDFLDRRIVIQPNPKVFDLPRLNVDHEEGRRYVRQVASNRPAKIGVDLTNRGKNRQPQTKRQYNRRRLAARAANSAECQAPGTLAANYPRTGRPSPKGGAFPRQQEQGMANAPRSPPAAPSVSVHSPEKNAALPISAAMRRGCGSNPDGARKLPVGAAGITEKSGRPHLFRSGPAAKALKISAARTPYSAASASGRTCREKTAGTGRRASSIGAKTNGSAVPRTRPATRPTRVSAPICRK